MPPMNVFWLGTGGCMEKKFSVKQILAVLILSVFCLPVYADSKTAAAENTKGMKFYKQKDYQRAVSCFDRAIQADPQHVLARYNLACTISLILEKDTLYCQWIERYPDIIKNLKIVLQKQPALRKQIVTDPDLALIRKDFDYYMLIDAKLSSRTDIISILTNVNWGLLGSGVIEQLAGLVFSTNNTCLLWKIDQVEDDIKRKEYRGTYQLVQSGGTFQIIVQVVGDDKNKIEYAGTITSEGVLQLKRITPVQNEQNEQDEVLEFRTFYSTCSA